MATKQNDKIEAAYEAAHANAARLTAEISRLLYDLTAVGNCDDSPVNWGHVGTVNEVVRKLQEVVDFLK